MKNFFLLLCIFFSNLNDNYFLFLHLYLSVNFSLLLSSIFYICLLYKNIIIIFFFLLFSCYFLLNFSLFFSFNYFFDLKILQLWYFFFYNYEVIKKRNSNIFIRIKYPRDILRLNFLLTKKAYVHSMDIPFINRWNFSLDRRKFKSKREKNFLLHYKQFKLYSKQFLQGPERKFFSDTVHLQFMLSDTLDELISYEMDAFESFPLISRYDIISFFKYIKNFQELWFAKHSLFYKRFLLRIISLNLINRKFYKTRKRFFSNLKKKKIGKKDKNFLMKNKFLFPYNYLRGINISQKNLLFFYLVFFNNINYYSVYNNNMTFFIFKDVMRFLESLRFEFIKTGFYLKKKDNFYKLNKEIFFFHSIWLLFFSFELRKLYKINLELRPKLYFLNYSFERKKGFPFIFFSIGNKLFEELLKQEKESKKQEDTFLVHLNKQVIIFI